MDTLESLLRSAGQGARLVPTVVGKPQVLARWLHDARAAQVAAAAFALFLVLGIPALSGLLERLYPPLESENALVRVFDRLVERPDPRLEARRRQLTAVTWVIGTSAVAALLLSSLPAAAESARRTAHGLAGRAEDVANVQPGESLLLYRSAISWTVDANDAAVLQTKLREAEELAASGVGKSAQRVRTDTELRALRVAQTVIAPVGTRAVEEVGDRYRILKELGRGGMGVVYQALDLVLEREVALKELPAHLGEQSEFARRFRQEARLVARLSHPHIVQVFDLVDQGNRLWIAMELVRGGTLADEMRRSGGSLAWPRAVSLARQIAAGLDYAHTSGVIHRDVKPINVLLTHETEGAAKLTDFGLAKVVEASAHTQEGTLLGSARYMSPEQAAGMPTDSSSDVYALGITIYEMLAGRTPFEGEVAAILAQHIGQPPRPLREWRPDVPEALAELVSSLLAKRPEDRPTNLHAVVSTLDRLDREAASATTLASERT